jgi:hypothetical protein
MNICYPDSTDWSCAYTVAEITEMRENPATALSVEVAEAFAWSLLAALTAYQIGTCPVTIRPCAARCAPSGTKLVAPVGRGYSSALPVGTIGRMSPYISGGRWYNACGCGTGSCDCSSLPTVELPGPVGGIVSVYLDGVLVPATSYRVDNGSLLVRTDGESWPACQDMSLSDQDGFSVTYYRGAAPNTMTNRAAGVLANEFYQSCIGAECRLPSNITSATRGGESYQFDQGDFTEVVDSIPELGAIVRIYNPYGLKAPVSMASPETLGIGGRVTTWRR